MKYGMGNVRDIPGVLPLIHGRAPRMRGRNQDELIRQSTGMAKKPKTRTSRLCLASNLRAARSLFRWSQEELGFQCGLKRTYIGALERREVNPGIDNLDKLAVGVLSHIVSLFREAAGERHSPALARSVLDDAPDALIVIDAFGTVCSPIARWFCTSTPWSQERSSEPIVLPSRSGLSQGAAVPRNGP